MDFSSFLLMRQEIILLTIILLLVVAEISISKTKKHSIVHLAIFLFGIHTVVGFFTNRDRQFVWRHVPHQCVNSFL